MGWKARIGKGKRKGSWKCPPGSWTWSFRGFGVSYGCISCEFVQFMTCSGRRESFLLFDQTNKNNILDILVRTQKQHLGRTYSLWSEGTRPSPVSKMPSCQWSKTPVTLTPSFEKCPAGFGQPGEGWCGRGASNSLVFQQPNRAESIFLSIFFVASRDIWEWFWLFVFEVSKIDTSSTSLMTWSQQESTAGRVVLGVAGQAPLRIGTNRWYPGYLQIASNSHYSWMFRPPIRWQFHR